MHRLKMRPLLLIAGLIGLAAIVFGLVNTTNSVQATTNDNGWKLIGTSTDLGQKAADVWNLNIPANAKTVALTKGALVITKSNPASAANDHPSIWRVIAYKTPKLTLERVQAVINCNIGAPPAGAPGANLVNIYTGNCNKIVIGGGNAADLSGVSDLIVDAGNPTLDAYHCIFRTDIAAGNGPNNVKNSAVCFDSTGALGQGGIAEPINSPAGEGTVGGGVGPPPPPPYSVAPPAKGRGTYNAGADTLDTTSCFPDVGKSVNIIASVSLVGAHAQLTAGGQLIGTTTIWTNQTNANCDALTPVGVPFLAATGIAIYPATDIAACGSDPGGQPAGDCVQSPYRLNGNVLHGYPDWDQDGCTDADELWQSKPNAPTKCGDDPWNPLDVPAGATPDASGEYSLTAVALRQDVGVPGFYYTCDADINQSGKNLTARVICYLDSPLFTVNPQAAIPAGSKNCPPAAAQYCGDGISGAPPPGTTVGTYPTNARLFADVDTKHTVLTGAIDNIQNVIKLTGCFEDLDGAGGLGNVYVDAVINLHTGHGAVKLWTAITPAANCTQVGGPGGAPGAIIPVHIARQNMKVADPFPAAGASTGHDADTDGCSDKRELVDTANRGGLRDPSNHYDYFNPTQDGLNRVDDILAVVNQYFLDDPPGAPDMKSLTDRTALIGGNAWNLGPPNGQQRVDDILNSVKQYFHDC